MIQVVGESFARNIMKERRKFERFTLSLPARLEVTAPEGQQIPDLVAHDISAGGAFFPCKEELPEGTRVKIDMKITNEKLKEMTGARSLIRVEGTVVRSGATGVAICFDGECQIVSLKSL